MTPLGRECAWCGRSLDKAAAAEAAGALVTHGICPDCKSDFFQRPSPSLRGFLERLGVPVVVLGTDAEVLDANSQARRALGRDLPEAAGRRWGEVMECVHARLPGGCGSAVHCRSCAIRRAVGETYATGRSLRDVPAYLDTQTEAPRKTLCFRISTEKVGQLVLLRVDDLREEPSAP